MRVLGLTLIVIVLCEWIQQAKGGYMPDLCKRTTSVLVVSNSSEKDIIEEGAAVYISKDVVMTSLIAYYCERGNAAVYRTIEWAVEIKQLNLNNLPLMCPKATFKLRQDIGVGFGYSYVSVTGLAWNRGFGAAAGAPMPRGGIYTVSVSEIKQGTSKLLGTRSFRVLGTNPAPDAVSAELKKSTPLWYAVPVAHDETLEYGGFRQFYPKGPYAGWPIVEKDNGTGIMQLTVPLPNCDQAWNWKENVYGGAVELNRADQTAKQWMDSQRVQARKEMHINVPVPTQYEANCVFREEGPRTIKDAVAMKIYNGAKHHYCSWDNDNHQWYFNRINSLGFNYVNRVCQVADPEK